MTIVTILTIFLLTLAAMAALVVAALLAPLAFDFLYENFPRFMNCVFIPLSCVLFFSLLLADVGACYLENRGPEDAVETVDCSAPDIQCVNADGDHR